MGVARASQIVTAIYAPDSTRARIAAMAPEVLAACDESPEDAARLLPPAGAALAETVAAVARRSAAAGPLPLAAAGSFLLSATALRQAMLDDLAGRGYQPALTPSPSPPAAPSSSPAAPWPTTSDEDRQTGSFRRPTLSIGRRSSVGRRPGAASVMRAAATDRRPPPNPSRSRLLPAIFRPTSAAPIATLVNRPVFLAIIGAAPRDDPANGVANGRGGQRLPGFPHRLLDREPDDDPLVGVDQQPAPTPPACGQQQVGRRLVGLVQRQGAAAVRTSDGREPIDVRIPSDRIGGEAALRRRRDLIGATARPGRRGGPQAAVSPW